MIADCDAPADDQRVEETGSGAAWTVVECAPDRTAPV